ncbi:hypothetical protein SlGVgp034 [Spodoptera litura granulovirus]|uniref:Uncharacterized protein n=1 Tax=Spodoptera litura granulovirus TaxID=359919 RepID=A5IZN6_9BBAC|nr:hypothetical protein SlGVgp034 [Spodoptera litura granulovirus]ABQ51977.1 hypothetical protein SlGVgp034 [Spodoptera litura granulovirus]
MSQVVLCSYKPFAAVKFVKHAVKIVHVSEDCVYLYRGIPQGTPDEKLIDCVYDFSDSRAKYLLIELLVRIFDINIVDELIEKETMRVVNVKHPIVLENKKFIE